MRVPLSWLREYVDFDLSADELVQATLDLVRGLGLANTLAAIEEGVDRVHGTALGMGERVGNAEMDLLLINLKLLGAHKHDLSKLPEYSRLASRACGVPIPPSYPVLGDDAFRTGTGVHAAAIIKARKKGDDWLADRVYSGVPASMVGRTQTIEVGPMSGLSNVQCWLENHGIAARPELVDAIFQRDYPLVMATSFIFAVIVVLGNLLADVLYAVADPRIRYD